MAGLFFGGRRLVALVACGGNKVGPDGVCFCFFGDGGPDALDPSCDVLAQTGCGIGEKCTWIWDQRGATAELGHIGCSMDGTVAAGSACTFNMDPIGFDNCVRGTFCEGGVCKEICDNNGGTPMCPADKACGAYSGVFGAAGQPVAAGLCDPDAIRSRRSA